MPTADRAQETIKATAYAVKTGQQSLKDLPDGTREKVRSALKTMTDRQLREYATSQRTPQRRVAQRGPQARVRAARGA